MVSGLGQLGSPGRPLQIGGRASVARPRALDHGGVKSQILTHGILSEYGGE